MSSVELVGVKSVRFHHQSTGQIRELLSTFRDMVNEAIHICLEENIKGQRSLRNRIYEELRQKCGVMSKYTCTHKSPRKTEFRVSVEPDESLTTLMESMVDLASVATVVEVGFGSGSTAFWFGRQLKGRGKVVAFDTSSRAVKESSETARRKRVSNVLFELGDAYAIPLPDSFADLAFCKSLLCVLDRPGVALSEMLRTIRPGGQILAVEPASSQFSYDPDDEQFSSLSNELANAFYQGWKKRSADQHFGVKLAAGMHKTGLSKIHMNCYCKSLLLSDKRRSISDVIAQLETEAMNLPMETEKLVLAGGMSVENLRRFHSIARRRLDEFRGSPERIAQSGYTRILPIFVVVTGRKKS